MHNEESANIRELIRSKQVSDEEGFKLYQKLIARTKSTAVSGKSKSQAPVDNNSNEKDIAIVGLSGVFPSAGDVEQLWEKLVNGKSAITEIPSSRWKLEKFYHPDPSTVNRSYCKDGGFMPDVDKFDPFFFNITPKHAEIMDPRQRIFLQEAYRAFEDAGYSSQALEGQRCGVFVGCEGSSDYFTGINPEGIELSSHYFLGDSNSVLASRISYFLDLKGPSITIDTACSSSLVAIHLACESIRSGDCSMAISGGVTLMTKPLGYLLLSRMGMLSPGGTCKVFDNSADGFVPGEAAGVVVLKLLSDAVADGDYIYGVIKSSGINQDGKTNGITAPSAISQTALETEVYEKAGIHPESISYVEAHGTGTKLGDPIEFSALTDTFRKFTDKRQFCPLGSIKSNVGHTGAASGVTGLIKILLALKYGTIPASLHYSVPNEHISFADSPFFVVAEPLPWSRGMDGTPRRAALSSFGHSGTNCHMVIEEGPVREHASASFAPSYLIPLSAKTEDGILRIMQELLTRLESGRLQHTLAEIAGTLQTGRSHFAKRAVLFVQDTAELKQQLKRSIQEWDKRAAAVTNKKDFPGSDGVQTSHALEDIWLGLRETRQSDSLAYKQNLEWLGECYLDGAAVEWERLYAGSIPGPVPLPGYPFAKERYWMTEADANDPVSEPKPAYTFLEKRWKEAELETVAAGNPQKEQMQGTVLVLINKESEAIAIALQQQLPHVRTVIVRDLGANPPYASVGTSPAASGRGVFDFNIFSEGADAAGNLVKHVEREAITAIIDLSDWGIGQDGAGVMGRIGLLQQVIKDSYPAPGERRTTLRLFHLTQGLQTFENDKPALAGAQMAGWVRMLSAEYSHVQAKTLDMEMGSPDPTALSTILNREWHSPDIHSELCYRNQRRYAPYLQVQAKNATKTIERGSHWIGDKAKTVVITGGTRGLGAQLAASLVKQGVRRLVLMGVSALPPRSQWDNLVADSGDSAEKIRSIRELERNGAEVELYTGPLTDEASLIRFFAGIRQRWGAIGGVIHCAGRSHHRNPAFIHKTAEDILDVLAPKVTGLQVLDRVFAKDELGYFILFSSISGIVPTLGAGVSDYAAANAYMDYFASCRRGQGDRKYQAISWTHWRGAGMEGLESPAYQRLGLRTHSVEEGLELLDSVMESGLASTLPCAAESAAFDPAEWLKIKRIQPEADKQPAQGLPPDSRKQEQQDQERRATESGASGKMLPALKDLFCRELKIPLDKLEPNIPFGDFGVDSILLAELVTRIEEMIGQSLEPTVVLEHPTLAKLASHLETFAMPKAAEQKLEINVPDIKTQESAYSSEPRVIHLQESLAKENLSQKIAVVGMACHFPRAPDKNAFWDLLTEGRSGITEIPAGRWDVDKYYSPQASPGRSMSKWGGFIEDIEQFDPQYFNISKEDAPYIDPLMRQFMEVSAETLRDAGYETKELWNKKVGVFVGARAGAFSPKLTKVTKKSIIGIGQNFIAAHISHLFNFRGPSLVIDSACSSSLVSLHLACQSLLLNECEAALAGGVDILLDEKPYLILSEGGALSPDGQCHTFAESANGFVPGEGCGAVLLKRLEQAIEDGDQIYAVIEGSAVNNDGRTMGITTPNAEAQEEVIREAVHKSGADPATISYVEAHGTGTMIGDPIELRALSNVFRSYTEERQYCAVGSVKSNIGHLLCAAGIASFIKVVLSLKNGQLPPTLNCQTPNPRFKFQESPFYPNTALKAWEPRQGYRRAGISSFGFGGTNAHLIVGGYDVKSAQKYNAARAPLPKLEYNRSRYWPETQPSVHSRPGKLLILEKSGSYN
ncbi:type I polyketide synthase [Paenibacillus monticola]|uniref:SDR family NAD(P)-dependent oxidoreductase n=1 Tax=Paenibacillus monticola TaxID=2666075 RepID=A0A7X2H1W7_9BACL|nr:type I polyketide synthase [Paenibacillus monticola]MRN51868.1 SDR family NAD(P)-dependent oxidoreductase [Paenibacillus monticola]